ncbi:MAG: PspA/IM30 family protein [Chloroflexota bacterium]
MGIYDRMSSLIRANLNDMLDRAEDPEKMINQIIRDMESSIQSAREQVAAMIVQEKELEADARQTQTLASEWGSKAERAVAAGKDELAREALRRKRDNERNSAIYGEQLKTQKDAVVMLKEQLRQLEAKYQDTLSRRDSFIARQRRAQAQKQVATAASATVMSPLDPAADLDRMERKIRQTEAEAAAALEMGQDSSLDAQFRELGFDDDIETELAILKAGGERKLAELTDGSDN